MQIGQVEERVALYTTIADMGLVMSPTAAIERARKIHTFYETVPLLDSEINRVCYYGKHIRADKALKNGGEIWIDGKYVCGARVEWIPRNNDPVTLYGVLDHNYPFDHEASIMVNHNVVFRVSKYDPDNQEVSTYIHRVAESEVKGVDMYNACYYITCSRYFKPYVSYADGYYTITCKYIGDLDLFCLGNLVYCGSVEANKGFVIDDVLEEKVYTRIVVDNQNDYPIRAEFYPWLCVDKNAFVRVYSDTYTQIRNPFTCRLINYPEFMEVEDPYNTDNEYLKNFKSSDVLVDPNDDLDTLYDKFKSMVGEWYRCFESYPYYRYASVFQLHTNTDELNPEFKRASLLLSGGIVKDVIISTFPFDMTRDVLFYDGMMFQEYSSAILHKIGEDSYEVAPRGTDGYLVYVLDGTCDPDKFCVIKFTASGEDTVVKNIGYYLNEENFLLLYKKINKFYRNIAVLQNVAVDIGDLGEEVYVGAEEPPVLDDKIWIELLTVAEEDVVKRLASRIPDSVTGLLPASLLEKMAEPLTPEEVSTELHKLFTDQDITLDDMNHHDIWIEWLDTIKDFVHFSVNNSIIVRLNEHLYLVELVPDAQEDMSQVQILVFDDVVMNFRDGMYGTRYLSIVADLYKSKMITDADITVFCKRLITSVDQCSPELARVKTYTSNVVTQIDRGENDMCIVYSTNLGRFQLTPEHFQEEDERDKLSKMIIPYKNIDDFAYLPGRVLIFLNGKLIPDKNIVEARAFELSILEFNEMIETIDIMYNFIDVPLMKLRRIALEVEPFTGEQPENLAVYNEMDKIIMKLNTLKGYYDVLQHDYLEGSAMYNRLVYFDEHPEEFEDFKKDLLDTFSPITTRNGLGDLSHDNRIVLWPSVGAKSYEIKRGEA